jgi:hypothetical protein
VFANFQLYHLFSSSSSNLFAIYVFQLKAPHVLQIFQLKVPHVLQIFQLKAPHVLQMLTLEEASDSSSHGGRGFYVGFYVGF